MKGVTIPGYRLTKDGKIEVDQAARLKKLPVNKRIPARESAKNKVRFTRNPAPKGG
jgi:hypothetical protein